MSPTTPSCAGDPSAASSSQPPPPPPPPRRFGGIPSSVSCYSPPPPPHDRFDFLREACGWISPSQDAFLRSSTFIRQQQQQEDTADSHADAIQRLYGRILYSIFGSESPHPYYSRRVYSDAETAEMALADYFIRLGPGRLRLLHQRQPLGGTPDGRAQFPSGPPEAPEERPDGMPPPAEDSPSCPLQATPATPARSPGDGGEKAAALKRGRPHSSYPSCSQSLDGRSTGSKKARVEPNAPNPTVGTCSPDAGVDSTGDMPAMAGGPPLADQGGRGSRKLPPSILFPVNWEEGGVRDEHGTGGRHQRPPPQVEREAAGKSPVAGAAARAPSACSPVDRILPAKNGRIASCADVPGVDKKQGSVEGDADRPCSPSLTTLVEERPPSMGRSDAISPSMVRSDAISISSFLDVLLRFSKSLIQTREYVELLETPTTEGTQSPAPRWWRPGGYDDRPSSPADK